ncbi:MAG: toll/interleukin-1 receptor domain-containing protein [Desulfobacterales bacterium]|nr:toll/interleukin-1 receptor domain-containing protein [Desulfobacterales bacterium]
MDDNIRFDVFLSYNSKDKPEVELFAKWLKQENIRIWFDKWELRPGIPWQREIEQGILNSISIVVFIGECGMDVWQEPEMRAALDENLRRGIPVIPVLLPNCPEKPEISLFLKAYTWVDFRGGLNDEDAWERLLWGITGKNPYTDTSTDNQKPVQSATTIGAKIIEGKNRLAYQKLEGFQEQEILLNEKIQYLQKAFLIQTESSHKFQLMKEIEQVEKELQKIESRINSLC